MAIVYGTHGSDFIDTWDGVTNGADEIFGYDGNDTIKGFGGNDLILGGEGADTIYGGSGIDTAYYHDSYTAVYVNLSSRSGLGGTANGDTLFDVENLFGSVYDDLLVGDDGANKLAGYGGRDVLKGGGGADALFGDEGDDSLEGGAGADTLNGGRGIDSMTGGAGDDVYYVDSASDVVGEVAGEGTDTVFSSANAHFLAANVENLSLDTDADTGVYGIGNAQANAIFGNANDNILDGGGSADQLNGLGGNDTFIFRAGEANGDTLHGFDGNGAGIGDVIYFQGYGTAAEGATFQQLNATTWEITSADGTIHDIITLSGAPTVDASDVTFY
jgi:Ca2+-binding RTX toxin-like protein